MTSALKHLKLVPASYETRELAKQAIPETRTPNNTQFLITTVATVESILMDERNELWKS